MKKLLLFIIFVCTFAKHKILAIDQATKQISETYPSDRLAPEVGLWIKDRFAEHNVTIEFVFHHEDLTLNAPVPLMWINYNPCAQHAIIIVNKATVITSWHTAATLSPEELFKLLKTTNSISTRCALILLAFNQNSIKAVLMHELGHVTSRHYRQEKITTEHEREADEFVIAYGDPLLIEAAHKYFEIIDFLDPNNSDSSHPPHRERAAYFKSALEKMRAQQ